MYEQKHPFFSPEASGWRGMVGLVIAALRLIVARAALAIQNALEVFNALPARVRSLTLILSSLSILMLVGVFFASHVMAYVGANQGPFLDDAITIPHGLNARAVPDGRTDAGDVLPERFGDYQRLTAEMPDNLKLNPVTLCLAQQPSLPVAEDAVNSPDAAAAEQAGDICKPGALAISRAYGRYNDPNVGAPFDIAGVRYENADVAETAMLDLLTLARQKGQVGNFAVAGVASVDFMYSAAHETLSLTWRHGSWIFSVSARGYTQLDAVMAAFPY